MRWLAYGRSEWPVVERGGLISRSGAGRHHERLDVGRRVRLERQRPVRQRIVGHVGRRRRVRRRGRRSAGAPTGLVAEHHLECHLRHPDFGGRRRKPHRHMDRPRYVAVPIDYLLRCSAGPHSASGSAQLTDAD